MIQSLRASHRRLALAGMLCLLALLGSAPVDAAQPGPRVQRMLVVSLPGVTWADVEAGDLPALQAFVASSAVADMAPRGVSPRSGPGDAYLTISAGSRATTQTAVDGQVLALEEQSAGSAAGEIFSRRTGLRPEGRYVSLAWPALVRANGREPYDAVLGLLASTLHDNDVLTRTIGNADGTDSVGSSYQRQAGLALADQDGVVADGALEEDLLLQDPSRPFGRRLSIEEVNERFEEMWSGGPEDRRVVVVEASDLARTLRYRPMVGSARYAELWDTALREADALLALLLESVDARSDSVLLVAPYNLAGDRDLTIAALRSPEAQPGYLRSASTQRSGFLTLVDVAPTILSELQLERPAEMEGRPAEVVASSSSVQQRISRLVSLNEASRFRERLLVPTTLVVVVGLALLASVVALLHVGQRGEAWASRLRLMVLVLLSLLPLSYLARAFPLEELGIGFYWAFVLFGAVGLAGVAALAGRWSAGPRASLLVVLSFMAVVLAGDVMTGSRLSLSAAFGYSPTGNSRLYGISNYSYGQISAAACLLAAFIAGSSTSTRARRLPLVLLLATLLVLGVPRWGSDVGGVLAFTPAIGVFAAVLFGWRIRIRSILAAGVATAVAIVGFGLLDLARPPSERAHLGRLFERVGDEGIGPLLSIIQRKLLANLEVSTSSVWVAAIPIALAFWLLLVRSPRRPTRQLEAATPGLRAGLAGAAVAAILGSLVNDSGAIVGGVASTVLTATLIFLLLEPSREPAGQAPAR
ncbi:MAG: hypothetical protein ACOYXM_01930 [Actinomycetota bacterium]